MQHTVSTTEVKEKTTNILTKAGFNSSERDAAFSEKYDRPGILILYV